MMRKPRVTTRCVANTCASPGERIIEFDGGLIRFQTLANGGSYVELYRLDDTTQVAVPPANLLRFITDADDDARIERGLCEMATETA